MVKDITPQDIIAKASKGYIKDYYASAGTVNYDNANKDLLRPSTEYESIKQLYSDHTFNYLVNKLVNSCTLNGYKIVNKNNPSKRSLPKEEEFRKLGYDENERSIFLNAIVYRNLYLESEFNINKTRVKKLYMLETTEMNINVDPHGEIMGYTQIHQSGAGVYSKVATKPKQYTVFFQPDECTHIAINNLTTNPYGFVDTKTIQHIVYYKNIVEEYINKLFKQNQYRPIWKIKDPTDIPQVKDFVENIKQGNAQPDKHFIVEGDVDNGLLRDPNELQAFTNLLNKYEESISRFLLVPPLLGGDVGNSNRSTGEFEVRYDFSTTIQSWQKIIANAITYNLFPNIGMSQYKLVYNKFDKIDQEKVLANAVQLKGLGYEVKDIHKYLVENGIELPADAKPKEPEPLITGGDGLGQKLQNMNAPSRKAKTKTVVGNKTGEDSSTREEQVIGKGKYDSTKYW